MGKFALLIGVGDYQSSELQNLAAALPDVRAIEKVLIDPAIADFARDDVIVLLNPEPQKMREAIDHLFADRKKDDLILLYFSGHGVTNDSGNFYFTSAITQKNRLDSTAIPATFVHGLMEGSKSQRQVVILDSCFSGAFAKDMKAKGEAVNLQPQLGGKGRAVLTSSSATEYSFEQKEAALSVYTQYVVEGLRTGIADRDEDGWISIDELHEFAREKVRELAPAMQPKIYAVEEGYKIVFAKAPVRDPKLVYRDEVKRLATARNGILSEKILMGLEIKQKELPLPDITAKDIRKEVLRPYQEFSEKVQKFQQALQKVRGTGSQITQQEWEDLSYLQKMLGLTDQDVKHITKDLQKLPSSIYPSIKHKTTINPFLKALSESDITKITSFLFSRNLGKSIALILVVGTFVNVSKTILQSVQSSTLTSPNYPPTSVQSPKTAHDWVDQALKKDEGKDYRGAIEDYTKAIELKPDFADAYYNRAISHKNLGDKNIAIADYQKAADIYQRQGETKDYQDALDQIKKLQ